MKEPSFVKYHVSPFNGTRFVSSPPFVYASMSHQHDTVKPYGHASSKKAEVGEMFDSIASTYDLLNRGTSLGVDTLWRAKMIRQLDPAAHKKSSTGDWNGRCGHSDG